MRHYVYIAQEKLAKFLSAQMRELCFFYTPSELLVYFLMHHICAGKNNNHNPLYGLCCKLDNASEAILSDLNTNMLYIRQYEHIEYIHNPRKTK